MKKTLKMILCLCLVISMFAGCTVVNVAKAGTVAGEDIPLGVYKYVLRIAEMYFGQVDYTDALSSIAMYDSYAGSLAYGAIGDILNEAGAAEEGKSIWEKAYNDTTVGDAVKDAVFDEIAKVYVVYNKALEKGVELTEQEKASITNFKNQLIEMMGTKAAFEEALDSINLTEKQLEGLWEKTLLASKLGTEIAEENAPTEEDMAKYFADNYVRVKHILIMVDGETIMDMDSAKAKADEVIAALNNGADFEALMTEYTGDKDAEGNVNGGDLGYVFKDGDFGNPAFEEASKALEIGQYTTEAVAVEGSYAGYHIIKRYEIPANYYSDNTNSVKDTIKSVLDGEVFDAYKEEVMKEAEGTISKKDSKIKGIKLTVTEQA